MRSIASNSRVWPPLACVGGQVALFSENSSRWLVADGAIMSCGAAGVVRGATAPPEELLFITQHSDAVGLVVQDGVALGRLLAAGLVHEQAQVGAREDSSVGEGWKVTREGKRAGGGLKFEAYVQPFGD